MKYRSRMDIVADILQITEGGTIKTKIMYQAFLSFPQLKEYLQLMTDVGLLKYAGENTTYHTTEKGRHFLSMYEEVGKTIAPKERRTLMLH